MTSTERVINYLSIPQERSVLPWISKNGHKESHDGVTVIDTKEAGLELVGSKVQMAYRALLSSETFGSLSR